MFAYIQSFFRLYMSTFNALHLHHFNMQKHIYANLAMVYASRYLYIEKMLNPKFPRVKLEGHICKSN